MSIDKAEISAAREQGRIVAGDLDLQLSHLRAAGVADVKMTVFPSKDTTTADIAQVATSVLARYTAGEALPLEVR